MTLFLGEPFEPEQAVLMVLLPSYEVIAGLVLMGLMPCDGIIAGL